MDGSTDGAHARSGSATRIERCGEASQCPRRAARLGRSSSSSLPLFVRSARMDGYPRRHATGGLDRFASSTSGHARAAYMAPRRRCLTWSGTCISRPARRAERASFNHIRQSRSGDCSTSQARPQRNAHVARDARLCFPARETQQRKQMQCDLECSLTVNSASIGREVARPLSSCKSGHAIVGVRSVPMSSSRSRAR